MSLIVDRKELLPPLVSRLLDSPWLAVDAEGDGLYRYRSRLCTLQLATDGAAAVVDPLSIEDLSALDPLLASDRPIKVVHDISFDARMLGARGLRFGRVFDTALAARFSGESNTGLASLLEKHLGVTVDKGLQHADWGERPITEERQRYLLDDVRHLVALAHVLYERARELDILEEIEEETRYAIARAFEPETERAPYTRIKGSRELSGRRLSLLVALADEREKEAIARDVPPFRVAPNAALVEAARRTVSTVPELRRIRGLRAMPSEGLTRALAVAAHDDPPVEPTPVAPPPEERARRRALEKTLTTWRAREATQRGVDVQVILPGHCLRDVVALDGPDGLSGVAGLGEKRLRLYGDALASMLCAPAA